MNYNIINMIIKNFSINIFSYIIFFKIVNDESINKTKKIIILITSIILTIIYIGVREYINSIFWVIFSYFYQLIILKNLVENKSYSIFIANLIANAIEYVIFTISSIIEFIPKNIFNITHASNIDFLLIILINGLILKTILNLKRIKKGFAFLKNKITNDFWEVIIINISSSVILAYTLFKDSNGENLKQTLPTFLILSISMITMIQKTLTLYYKQKQMIKTLKEYEDDIKTKDEQIQKLSEEKFKISKLNHEFYNRQKALELKVEELVSNANLNMETAGEISVVEKINKLSKEYSNKLETIKNLDKLPTTEIEEIDDMFKYMQSECKKNNIDFKLQINGNIHHMVNNIIPQDKLVTLIGDHLRDAIIAITSSENTYKSIVAILGIKDGCYEFCVNDTGREFEIETLLKLGLEPVTTYENAGGSGLGFMTTFETLKETKASLIIEEKHKITDNDYTKAVIIRFDKKNEYKIISYRVDEIKKKLKVINNIVSKIVE